MFISFMSLAVVYVAGFAIMFVFSAWRDGQHQMESDPLDTFLVALLWPLVLMVISVASVIGAFRVVFCQAYGFFYKIGEGKQ